MAQITLNIPDAVAPRVIDAICAELGYDGTGTKNAFAKQQLVLWMKSIVKQHEGNVIMNTKNDELLAARKANDDDVDGIGIT
jgi:hypothetical protein